MGILDGKVALGMAASNAGKHLFCEWPLAATTEQAQQMRDLAVRKGGIRQIL
jgi:predicted dehydrogenase